MEYKWGEKLSGVRIARIFTVSFLVQAQLRGQIESLIESGADVTVVSSEPILSPAIQGCNYISIGIARKISIVQDLVGVYKLWQLFRRERFTIVHSMTPKAGLLCAVAAFCVRTPIRLHTFTGQHWVKTRGISRFFFKSADKVIAVLSTRCYADSYGQRDFLVDQKVICQEKIKVLGAGSIAGVDTKRFDLGRYTNNIKAEIRRELKVPQNSAILLFVGRICEEKGVNELLSAALRLNDGRKDVSLVCVGPNEMKSPVLLKKVAKKLKERLVVLGHSDEPEKYMAVADILLLPSYREGFGTVIIEAAAMSLPAIGTDIYGLSDAIRDNETGMVVPVANARKLFNAIEFLLKSSEVRKSMGLLAKQIVLQNYSMTRMNELVIKEYSSLLVGGSK